MKDETVRNNIVETFRKYPKTKNNDNILVLTLIVELGFGKIKKDKIEIDLKKFESFPSFEGITRVRRKLNEEGLYLPEEEVIEKRKQKQSIYKDTYSPKNRNLNADSFGNSQLS